MTRTTPTACPHCHSTWLDITWCRTRDQIRVACSCGHFWFKAPRGVMPKLSPIESQLTERRSSR